MQAKDLPDWGNDPDYKHWMLQPDWPVRLEMVNLAEWPTLPSLPHLVDRYTARYRRHGSWALPPIVLIDLGGGFDLCSGSHRIAAARIARLRRLPALIVTPDVVAQPHKS